LNAGSLFSGIGLLDLGLHLAGIEPPGSPSSMTSEQSTALRLASIFSSAASPAEEQAPPARERAWVIQRLRSGGRWPESLASYDPDSSCWRTSRLSLLSTEEELGERWSGTWPRSGMWAHGTVFPLPPLAPRTSVTESSALLPSPMARAECGAEVSGESRTGGPMLGEALSAMLPTPRARSRPARVYPGNVSESSHARLKDGGHGDLEEQIAKQFLLPTPRERDWKGQGYEDQLPNQVEELSTGAATPTPSPDGKKSPAPFLNPCFVEWMLGAPAGWSDPDCPHSATEFKCRLGYSSANASSTTSGSG
jgi:hypothetical protein